MFKMKIKYVDIEIIIMNYFLKVFGGFYKDLIIY